MRKLAVLFSLVAGLASASDLGNGYGLILFGDQSIAAGQTNAVENDFEVHGAVVQAAVFQTGSGVSTTTVTAIRGNITRTILTITANNNAATSAIVNIPLYNENIRFTTVNYGTNAVSVSPAIFYDN